MGKNGGKKVGKYNFINCMGRALERLGHTIIYLSDDDLYEMVPRYDFINCIHDKKPINIKQIQYKYDPDFIYIEQMYYSLDVSEITCPVIYQHREYTHFPDILNPDILLASYHWRLRVFEFYHPWEYNNIPYKDYNYVAVDTEIIKPVEEKTEMGIWHIGLSIPMWQFREANGMFGDMVMEDQEVFWDKCIDEGYVHYCPTGLKGQEFIKQLGRTEALLYDAGRFAGLSRRLVEAMASKTLCVVRIHTKLQENFYKEIGLTDEMCFFIHTPEDVGKITYTEEERKVMAEKAYDWVIKNHTYDVRAKNVLRIVEEFNRGVKHGARFMGYALKMKVRFEGDHVVID